MPYSRIHLHISSYAWIWSQGSCYWALLSTLRSALLNKAPPNCSSWTFRLGEMIVFMHDPTNIGNIFEHFCHYFFYLSGLNMSILNESFFTLSLFCLFFHFIPFKILYCFQYKFSSTISLDGNVLTLTFYPALLHYHASCGRIIYCIKWNFQNRRSFCFFFARNRRKRI